MFRNTSLGDENQGRCLTDSIHRNYLRRDALAQLAFFRNSLHKKGGFAVLDFDGSPLPGELQELHTTTRLVHSYAMGHIGGADDCTDIIDAGLAFLWSQHRDKKYGGYLWSLDNGMPADDKKLAYGQVFVLLAASSAKAAGHPNAERLMADISAVLDRYYWDDSVGLLRDEYNRDWTPFSNYRGYNANMHGAEAFLSAYEVSGERSYLDKATRILNFFVDDIALEHNWRIPEHFTENWVVDTVYAGNPMFRPRGTTPGHSFELARLILQHWDLSGRPDNDRLQKARNLVETALNDAWCEQGGFFYTLDYDGSPQIADRYWWPVTEAIAVLATLIKIDDNDVDKAWYRKVWTAASSYFIDHHYGGWFPEIDTTGKPVGRQFKGKPDIYHAIQADLLPLTSGISNTMVGLSGLMAKAC